jgi:FkbM family methyltransferase
MRKIFIDLGANLGRVSTSFWNLMGKDRGFEVYCFEPNPKFKKHLTSEPFHYLDAAAWIHDGEVEFKIDHHSGGWGSTLMLNKWKGTFKGSCKVRSIDFSKWLLETFSASDLIILKMDVEGAEFQLIPEMHRRGALAFVDILIMEIHNPKKFSGMPYDAAAVLKVFLSDNFNGEVFFEGGGLQNIQIMELKEFTDEVSKLDTSS